MSRERDSLAQRAFERQTNALQAAVHSLRLSVDEAERGLWGGTPPQGTVRFTIASTGLVAEPADTVLWTAGLSSFAAVPQPLVVAEVDEYRGHTDRAVAVYRRLAHSPTKTTRAAALVRLARVRRAEAKWSDALKAYERMLPLAGTFVDGAPADLQARRAICDVLGRMKRHTAQRECAEALATDLAGGRWRQLADRATWEVGAEDVGRWTGRKLVVDSDRRIFSEIAEVVVNQPWATKSVDSSGAGWRTVSVSSGVAHIYVDLGSGRALAVSPKTFARWAERANEGAASVGWVGVLGPTGESLDGRPSPGVVTQRVTPAESRMPWTIALTALPSASAESLPGQRGRLTASLVAILLLLCGSTYFLWRTMSRELEVARLQAEFVSTVSHEFRTPLTSIRHVSELLEENEALPTAERRAFYAALTRNAQRLQRFVESLLDFARLDAGRRPYTMRPVDMVAFIDELVAGFVRDLPPHSPEIRCDADAGPLAVDVDSSALGHAIWNLLDNAVKYAPGTATVRVSVRRDGSSICIAVADSGIGIPADERQEIFERFIRGRAASRLGVRGTGLGLAIVSHIVRAHGGAVDVESVEGAGSTFTITMPAGEAGRDSRAEGSLVRSTGGA